MTLLQPGHALRPGQPSVTRNSAPVAAPYRTVLPDPENVGFSCFELLGFDVMFRDNLTLCSLKSITRLLYM